MKKVFLCFCLFILSVISCTTDTIAGSKTNHVYFYPNGGNGRVTEQSFVGNIPSALLRCAFTRPGYTFCGWSETENGLPTYRNNQIVTLHSDKSLYAQWRANSYTVTLVSEGSDIDSFTVVFDESTPNTVIVPSKVGYTFRGYYPQIEGGGEKYIDSNGNGCHRWDIPENVTLYAFFLENGSHIIQYKNLKGVSAPAKKIFREAENVTLANIALAGYTFDGWFEVVNDITSDVRIGGWSAGAKTSDVTLWAGWTANTYTVTLANDGDVSGDTSITATYNEFLPNLVNLPSKIGQTFCGYWSEAGGSGTQYIDGTGKGTAKWNTVGGATLYVKWVYNGVCSVADLPYLLSVLDTDGGPYQIKIQDSNPDLSAIKAALASYSNVMVDLDLLGCTELTGIGNGAFQNCTNLAGIEIPDSVVNIGAGAFSGCNNLENMTLPFVGGNNNSTTPNNTTFLGFIFGTSSYSGGIKTNQYSNDGANESGYTGGSSITRTYYIPSSLKSITVTGGYIVDGAFSECKSLTNVIIGSDVTGMGRCVFRCCEALQSVTLSDNLTYVGVKAFDRCYELTNIVIPDSVTDILYAAFWGCENLATIKMSGSVTSVGTYAFSGCTGLVGVDYTGTIEQWCQIEFESATSNPLCYAHNLYVNDELLTDLIIPDNVDKIKPYAFHGCSCLMHVTIPDSVTSIGTYAFSGCTGLTSIIIPNSVTNIGTYAFRGCTGLKSIAIPDSVTSIGTYAFSGCTELTSITIPNSVISIGDYVFYGCTGLTSITIPNSVTSIGSYAFRGCSGLTSITIPNSVTSIGNYAFRGCSGLTEPVYNAQIFAYMPTSNSGVYTIPSGITKIAGSAFYGCAELTSITIPNSVISIGDYVFYGCTGLTSITIPNSVTSIGSYAFYDCTGLTSITIPNSVTSIGSYAFRGCSGLTSITIPNSVTSIGSYAFSGCTKLTSITIPNSVTSIGNYAFSGCTGLTTLTVKASSPPSFGSSTLNNCSALTTIYVPAASVDTYKAASGWSNYADKIVAGDF